MSQQFFEAIRAGDRDQMSALLSADPTLLGAKDEKGLGAYTAAKYSGRNDIAALLLERGVELDIFAACMAGARERAVELIGRQPELIGSYSHDGWTPLHLACFFGQPALAETLIELGADVNARNNAGETPIFTTLVCEAIPILIAHGTDLTIRNNKGQSAPKAATLSHSPYCDAMDELNRR